MSGLDVLLALLCCSRLIDDLGLGSAWAFGQCKTWIETIVDTADGLVHHVPPVVRTVEDSLRLTLQLGD